jgi:membrane associated rhomboid family serine protease
VNQLIAAGQFWRLLTPALLHGGVVHLLVNCYSLNDLGPAAETLLGRRRFACLYAASAVSGNLASYFMNPGPGVGASGAIFGLVGCLAVYFARHRHLHGRAGELKLQCVARARGAGYPAGVHARATHADACMCPAQGADARDGCEPAARRRVA